jgi:SAM-dependent methyltransferase
MSLVSIDLGCGSKKRPGYVGLDLEPGEGIDHVVDFSRERLPFDDGSVGQVFSSHCIEHLPDLEHIFKEITRVCASGARVELWHPYSMHRDAFSFGHRLFLNEGHYLQIATMAPQHWVRLLGARWIVHDLVFAIPGETLTELTDAGIDVDFAVKYLNNVVCEMGAFIEIDKSGALPLGTTPPRRLYAVSRKPEDRHPIVELPPIERTTKFAERLRRFIQRR